MAFRSQEAARFIVLNYTVTSNHIHLLLKDTGPNVIAQSRQLIAGRTAQEYNRRKNRQGAFWEDRYHATAIEQDQPLHRCLVYIDLNMVRAGVVEHPLEWKHGGYREIQDPPDKIDEEKVMVPLFEASRSGNLGRQGVLAFCFPNLKRDRRNLR